ncbi:uncharacterized protein LOC122350469 isoform X2 [Puntigrus tetrazona]|nr:uncharacterized protein LOC122350469 isoform X2 [Puntigrus tetrazona]
MLDARESEDAPAGRFTLTDPSNCVLICGGRAVAHSNNAEKTRVEVLWTPEEVGKVFFRAAFVKNFRLFWLKKPLPTTAAPPTSEATSTQKIPTVFTTTSNATVGAKPPLQCVLYMRCVLALLLFSRLCFLGGSSLLMIIKPVSKIAPMTASLIELASKIIAAVIILIKLIQHECGSSQIVFTALTVAAMVSSLMHTLTVFLHCGPSHELRKCWLCAVIMVDLTNSIITTAVVFIGILRFQESWLPLLMGFYVVWEFMLYLGSVWFEKHQSRGNLKKNQNHILEKKTSLWLVTFIIFSVFNVMFTAALVTGVSLVKMKNS